MRPEILYPYFAALDSVAGIGKKTAGQEFFRPAFFMPVSV